jgi:hypothetical protein
VTSPTGPTTGKYESGLTSEQIQKVLHDPVLVQRQQQVAAKGVDEAQNLAVLPDAKYGQVTQNWAHTKRARTYVRPENAEATLDDAYHSTMLKSISAMRGA